MAQIPGTNVSSGIRPHDTADTYDTHDATYGKGGWRAVLTIAIRNAIPAQRRSEGMVVYVVADTTEYVLGADLTTWTAKPGGSGGTPGDTVTDLEFGGAPDPGDDTEYSRRNHSHGMPERHFNVVTEFGALGDVVWAGDDAITVSTSSTALSCATARFVTADVGKIIDVIDTVGGITHRTTIAARPSSTSITLTDACPFSLTDAAICYGTDDTSAIQAAIDDFQTNNKSGTVYFPNGRYFITAALLIWYPNIKLVSESFQWEHTHPRPGFNEWEQTADSLRIPATLLLWGGADGGTMIHRYMPWYPDANVPGLTTRNEQLRVYGGQLSRMALWGNTNLHDLKAGIGVRMTGGIRGDELGYLSVRGFSVAAVQTDIPNQTIKADQTTGDSAEIQQCHLHHIYGKMDDASDGYLMWIRSLLPNVYPNFSLNRIEDIYCKRYTPNDYTTVPGSIRVDNSDHNTWDKVWCAIHLHATNDYCEASPGSGHIENVSRGEWFSNCSVIKIMDQVIDSNPATYIPFAIHSERIDIDDGQSLVEYVESEEGEGRDFANSTSTTDQGHRYGTLVQTFQREKAHTNSSGAYTIDLNHSQYHKLTVTEAVTLTITPPAQGLGEFFIRVVNGDAHSITWPGNTTWLNTESYAGTTILTIYWDGVDFNILRQGSGSGGSTVTTATNALATAIFTNQVTNTSGTYYGEQASCLAQNTSDSTAKLYGITGTSRKDTNFNVAEMGGLNGVTKCDAGVNGGTIGKTFAVRGATTIPSGVTATLAFGLYGEGNTGAGAAGTYYAVYASGNAGTTNTAEYGFFYSGTADSFFGGGIVCDGEIDSGLGDIHFGLGTVSYSSGVISLNYPVASQYGFQGPSNGLALFPYGLKADAAPIQIVVGSTVYLNAQLVSGDLLLENQQNNKSFIVQVRNASGTPTSVTLSYANVQILASLLSGGIQSQLDAKQPLGIIYNKIFDANIAASGNSGAFSFTNGLNYIIPFANTSFSDTGFSLGTGVNAGRVTVPSTGRYRITPQVGFMPATTSAGFYLNTYTGGTVTDEASGYETLAGGTAIGVEDQTYATGGQRASLHASKIVSLTANDIVSVTVSRVSVLTENVTFYNSKCNLTIEYLGPNS